jgi:hypothetical protein
MVKRALLAFTFVAAFAVAGIGISSLATAHGGGCGYRSAYYGGYPAHYGYSYGPRVAHYPRAYPVYYGGYDYYAPAPRHHRHNGISISFGF